jgi:integrase
MSLTLRRQRDGTFRKHWYGEYVDGDRRCVVNLNVRWHGTPPKSGSLRMKGNAAFEKSRDDAQLALEEYQDKARSKGRAEHLVERLIESKTGERPEYVKIADLCERWLSMPREEGIILSSGYTTACNSIFKRFRTFMEENHPKTTFLYQVRPAAVNAFAAEVRDEMSPKTYRDHIRLLRPAFQRFLPAGAANPWASLPKGKRAGQTGNGSIHRRPLSPAEIQTLFNTAEADEDAALMAPLIICAACTGMRRADVCNLKWSAVNWSEGVLIAKAEKTNEPVEIPIFTPLRTVFESRRQNGSPYVFPEAHLMLEGKRDPGDPKGEKYLIKRNPDGLTYRFKRILARAFEKKPPTPPAKADEVKGPEVREQGIAAVMASLSDGPRRDHILDNFRRYMDGKSIPAISKLTGRSKGSISGDLSTVSSLIDRPVVRAAKTGNLKASITTVTRQTRKGGQRSASILDWHALRTSWVTIALSAGCPVELVQRVTGHRTVAVVLEHYFRPGREQFRAALASAMPPVLTGRTEGSNLAGEVTTHS